MSDSEVVRVRVRGTEKNMTRALAEANPESVTILGDQPTHGMDGRALAPVTLSVPDGVSYDGHSAKALLELAQERELEGVTSRTTKPQLIAALTEADRVRASGFVDGANGADDPNDQTPED